MANKLGINRPRPADLSSLSVYPSLYERSNNLRRYNNSQRDQGSRQRQSQQSLLYSASSQSQKSFSQGVTFSQPFSQLSQDDPATPFEEWRCNREGRPSSSIPPARVSETLKPEDSSRKLSLSKTSTLLSQLNSRPSPETSSHVAEEIVKRLEILDEGLSKVITMLDSVQGDVQKLFKSVQSATLDSEGLKQKMKQQESSLQSLLKEDEKMRTALTTGLNKLYEQKSGASNLATLFDEIHSIPVALTGHLSLIKSDLFACIRNELQTIRECVKSRIDGWTTAETLPYTAVNFTEAVFPKSRLPAHQGRKSLSRAPATRKRPPRKTAPTVKQPCKKSTSCQTGQRQTLLNRVGSDIVDNGLPALGRRTRRTPTKGAAAKEHLNPSPATINLNEEMTLLNDPKRWSAPKTTLVKHPEHSKRPTMEHAKVESNYMDSFTFEMEEEAESFFVPGNSSSRTKNVSEVFNDLFVEDEAKAIRKKMKAQRKRKHSTCVSLSD